jgi:succinate dehydrogenase hydrophobic anchor subunit
LLAANFFVFWHINAGIEEIVADYVHHEMTREFVLISLRLFLIIAIKDVFLNFVFV